MDESSLWEADSGSVTSETANILRNSNDYSHRDISGDLTPVVMESSVFQDISQCSKSEVNRGLWRGVAQAISHWLPTAIVRVQGRVMLCRICDRQSGSGAGFLQVLRFPLPVIPPTAPHSSSVAGIID
jgi:hypothetical protein